LCGKGGAQGMEAARVDPDPSFTRRAASVILRGRKPGKRLTLADEGYFLAHDRMPNGLLDARKIVGGGTLPDTKLLGDVWQGGAGGVEIVGSRMAAFTRGETSSGVRLSIRARTVFRKDPSSGRSASVVMGFSQRGLILSGHPARPAGYEYGPQPVIQHP
jgi:hypothetical protein